LEGAVAGFPVDRANQILIVPHGAQQSMMFHVPILGGDRRDAGDRIVRYRRRIAEMFQR
jgi:hypothetical protein